MSERDRDDQQNIADAKRRLVLRRDAAANALLQRMLLDRLSTYRERIEAKVSRTRETHSDKNRKDLFVEVRWLRLPEQIFRLISGAPAGFRLPRSAEAG